MRHAENTRMTSGMGTPVLSLDRGFAHVMGALALAAAIGAAGCAATPAADAVQSFSGYSVTTRHSGVFNGVAVAYSATFEDIVVTGADGAAQASLFATSYLRDGDSGRTERPVIFIWSGGPSASSQTLHIAGFGPKRLVVPLDVTATIAAPYEAKDNVHTLLDVADLVFVDPVNTGYSRMLAAGDEAYFYSAEGDAASIAQFMGKWLERHGRGDSPVYVLGSSYGSIRAALVAGMLAKSATPLAGAILFSQGVNLVETTQRKNSLIGYASNLSQEAAIAWYHGRSALQEKTVGEVIAQTQEYAMGEYLVAIGKGNSLAEPERVAVASRLAELTGIAAETWLASGLMISKSRFRSELLRDGGLVIGATDARYTAAADSAQAPASPTQGVADVQRANMAEFLQITLPADEYRGFAPGTGSSWDYGGSSTLDGSKLAPEIVRTIFADYDFPAALVPAFEANDKFRVMIATGIFDLLTTVGPARLLASNPAYPADRVEMHEYVGGHAFYSNDGEFERLANDIRHFIR